MMYEAQIAGQGDATGSGDARHPLDAAAVRARAARASRRDRRRAARHRAARVRQRRRNGLARAARHPIRPSPSSTAGSGLLAGHLFDGYRAFDPAPAAAFALEVVRKPAPDIATVLGGGWIASGPPVASRQPLPVWPAGLKTLGREGAGEVQTPLQGEAARALQVGDRVWFRHSKSGELAERVDQYHLVDDGAIVGEAPTYRGEGKAFL